MQVPHDASVRIVSRILLLFINPFFLFSLFFSCFLFIFLLFSFSLGGATSPQPSPNDALGGQATAGRDSGVPVHQAVNIVTFRKFAPSRVASCAEAPPWYVCAV